MSGVLRTIWVDICESVFDNETEAIMYITRDIYSNAYIVAIPVITFAWAIVKEKDYDNLIKTNLFGFEDRRKKLVNEIRKGIADLEKGSILSK